MWNCWKRGRELSILCCTPEFKTLYIFKSTKIRIFSSMPERDFGKLDLHGSRIASGEAISILFLFNVRLSTVESENVFFLTFNV